MMKFLKGLLIFAGFAAADIVTIGNGYIKGGHLLIGSDTILTNVGLDVNSKTLSGTRQIGAFIEPNISNASTGGEGIRISPKVKAGSGHIPYVNALTISAPSPGAGAGYNNATAITVLAQTGCDTNCAAWRSFAGPMYVGDTLNAQKFLKFGGGVNYHGAVLSVSRQITDTDYVMLFDISSGALHDTLPALSSALGREYWFVQYSSSAAGNFVLKPHAGDKIETYDSLCMRSNLGISYMQILGVGTKWKVVSRHEKGAFQSTLTGVSTTTVDTGFYTMDNLLDFSLQIRPLVGTSNATSMGISGFGTNFTISGLDTTNTISATIPAYNNGTAILGTCIIPLSGASATCLAAGASLGSWTNTGTKGISYGFVITYHLPRPAPYN